MAMRLAFRAWLAVALPSLVGDPRLGDGSDADERAVEGRGGSVDADADERAVEDRGGSLLEAVEKAGLPCRAQPPAAGGGG